MRQPGNPTLRASPATAELYGNIEHPLCAILINTRIHPLVRKASSSFGVKYHCYTPPEMLERAELIEPFGVEFWAAQTPNSGDRFRPNVETVRSSPNAVCKTLL